MDKLKMQTLNLADEKYKKLAELFPNAVTETVDPVTGEVVRAIDRDVLMQEINTHVVEGREERYQFTWPDKKKAVLAANAPISATLRPVKADSAGRDGTPGGWDSENLYIEGDNLDVLKLLRETYLGKVKMIYIDPPYNTGNDFVYEDDFAEDMDSYMSRSGQYDDQGNQLVQNTDSNGRFHTDWLNMIYPRLRIAKDLLSEDGLIFISIDDREQDNMRKLCDEAFGRANFIAQIIWQKRTSPDARRVISDGHEYILVYAKNEEIGHKLLKPLPFDSSDYERYKNPDNDPRGPWISTDCTAQGGHGTKDQFYDFVTPAGRVVKLQEGLCWRYTKKKMEEEIAAGRIWFGVDGNGVPRKKTYLSERIGKNLWTWWSNTEVGHTQEATKETAALLNRSGIIDFPKPVRLIKRILSISTDANSIVLDFFSGSATTAHAVMKLNAEDGGHRKFIMVQLPEVCDEKSEAYKAGYRNICEIGKERIRRAGRKIQDEAGLTAQNLDVGFRVLRLDSSNMQDVYYNPAAMTQDLLSLTTDNIKPDRTPEDLLFQVMLELGVLPSSPISETVIDGKRVFDVADGFLLACFDAGVTSETVTAIAKRQPYYAVFRDSSMADDSVATNFDQIFETYSPSTVRKVL